MAKESTVGGMLQKPEQLTVKYNRCVNADGGTGDMRMLTFDVLFKLGAVNMCERKDMLGCNQFRLHNPEEYASFSTPAQLQHAAEEGQEEETHAEPLVADDVRSPSAPMQTTGEASVPASSQADEPMPPNEEEENAK